MEKLTEEEIQKLREMAKTWEQVHLASTVLQWLGRILSWVSGIIIAITAIWTVMKMGGSGK